VTSGSAAGGRPRGERPDPGPERTYRERLDHWRSEARSAERRSDRIGDLRLAVTLAFAVGVWLALTWEGPTWPLPLFFAAAFLALLVVHERLGARIARHQALVAHYEQGLRRLDGDWVGHGYGGEDLVDPEHPYAADIDLFGRGSLFELMCTTRTAAGAERLARWLQHPGEASEARGRQAAVGELFPRLDLREAVVSLCARVDARVRTAALVCWCDLEPTLDDRWKPQVAWALTLAAPLAIGAWAAGIAGPIPLALVAVADALFLRRVGRDARRVESGVDRALRELEALSALLERWESEAFDAPLLARLRSALGSGERAASSRIALLARLLHATEQQRNILFAPLALLLLWPYHQGRRLESWRVVHGAEVKGWLDALADLEALTAVATYAFEHPRDPFPVILDSLPTRFEGRGLAHPLLGNGIANDVVLDATCQALLVTGSNMSGKSTLLRTVGANAVLALAGAPVRADALAMSALHIGSTIRIDDSVIDGTSRFYRELQRLRRMLDLARAGPLLFLLDELFGATNSVERRIGAVAVLEELLGGGAVGLVTTHDIDLARLLVEDESVRAVHFEERIEAGRLVFDHRLRAGVASAGNALQLMRDLGFRIDSPAALQERSDR